MLEEALFGVDFRGSRHIRVALIASVATLLLCSASAHAARDHVFSFSFGGKGSAAGQFSEPEGVAVNESSGDIYVVDRGNDRVEHFDSTGAYVDEFNGSGVNVAVEGKAAPTGRLSKPGAIAVDNEQGSPSQGDVYVADVGNHVVDKFSATGEYIGQLSGSSTGSEMGSVRGLAVDGRGKLWVCQAEKEIDAFSNALANEFVSKITSTGLAFNEVSCGFAVDSSDDLYGNSGFTGVGKLNSSGEVLILEFDSLLKEFYGVTLGPVAVDLANSEVYIGNANGENSIGRFTSAGKVVETFGSEHLTKSSGIAVDSGTGRVYVADGAADRVEVFIPEPEARPTIESEGASAVTGNSVTLGAQIKPTGPLTTYYFQYGTADCAVTPGDCTDVPAAPGVDIGGGFESLSVSVHVQGLQPATIYHFGIVATNALGKSEAEEQSFTTQTVGGELVLPDGRMWEMVTPPNKYGSDLIAVDNEQGAAIQAAANGSAITYGATAPFALNPAGSRAPEVTQVFSNRTAPGVWATADISTPHDEGAKELAVGHSAEYKLFSSNLAFGLVEPADDTPLPPLPAGAERTLYLREADGSYKALVTSANVPPGTKFGNDGEGGALVNFVSASPDFSHVILASRLKLTAATQPAGELGVLYDWTEGQLQLASVLPDGEPSGGSLGEGSYDVRNAISSDGSRVVWQASYLNQGNIESGNLYLRDTVRRETIAVDSAQGMPEPPADNSRYGTASSDDSRVFFVSPEKLTADATAAGGNFDLYQFEVTSAGGQPLAGKLVDLTVDRNAGETADVRGVLGASEDGTYVYFVANGVLGDGAEHGARNGDCERGAVRAQQTCNLYVEHYDAGAKAWMEPTFIATLSGGDAHSWDSGQNLTALTSRVAPNGRYLSFMSARSLTGYENRDANSGAPDEEVYLYDGAAGRLACVSCNPTGARPVGFLEGSKYEEHLVDYAQNWLGQWVSGNIPGWTAKDLSSAAYQSRYLSSSGRLFFNSADALVPGDVNGKEDVYEYEPEGVGGCRGASRSASEALSEGGCVALISAGTSTEESAFMDASEGGGDVFFITGSRLAQQDFDTSLDLYDAHECTGASSCAPAPALAPPPCTTGDACKAAPTPQPTIFGAPSSETFSGAGNVVPVAPSRSTTRSLTRTQKLAKALRVCRKRPRKLRAACQRQVRRRYGGRKSSAAKSSITTRR